MLNSFIALKYKTQDDSDLPTICAWMDRLVGEKLDYNNLSKEDFKELLKNEEVYFVRYPELDPETIELSREQIYNAKKKCIPNKYYVPKGFDKKLLVFDPEEDIFTEDQIEEREDLEDNTIVMLYKDELSFPAYRNQEGHIEFHNPDLLLVVHYNKVPINWEDMLKD